MKSEKREFIRFLVDSGCLKFGDFQLKSGDRSPFFVNLGRADSGAKLDVLGRALADAVQAAFPEATLLFGPAYKGIALAVAAAASAWYRQGKDLRFFYDRKEAKAHGERGSTSGICLSRRGRGDDHHRRATAERRSRRRRRSKPRSTRPAGIVVAVDRRRRTTPLPVGLPPVRAVIDLGDLCDYLEETRRGPFAGAAALLRRRIAMAAKEYRIIPALDTVDLPLRCGWCARVAGANPSAGFKLGFGLGLGHGLPETVRRIREWTDKPLIYDHQKAATDIPDTGALFGDVMKMAGDQRGDFVSAHGAAHAGGVDARDAGAADESVIVGAVMTHPAYLVSEGGFYRRRGGGGDHRQAAVLGVGPSWCWLTADLGGETGGRGAVHGGTGILPRRDSARRAAIPRFPALAKHFLIMGRALFAAEDPAKNSGSGSGKLGMGV